MNHPNRSKIEYPYLCITASGGTGFHVHMVRGQNNPSDWEHIGNTEFGAIDADGQYLQDDDEIIDYVRAEFRVPESVPARVR